MPTTRLMRVFLRVEDITVSEVTVAQQTHYSIKRENLPHPSCRGSFHNYNVRTVITSNGRIRLLDVTDDTTVRDGSRTVTDRPRYMSVGKTTVS
jgi:hypothetical protein